MLFKLNIDSSSSLYKKFLILDLFFLHTLVVFVFLLFRLPSPHLNPKPLPFLIISPSHLNHTDSTN